MVDSIPSKDTAVFTDLSTIHWMTPTPRTVLEVEDAGEDGESPDSKTAGKSFLLVDPVVTTELTFEVESVEDILTQRKKAD